MLALNRHVLSFITSSQADSLLLAVKHLWQQKPLTEAARLTAFSQAFQLLAKWAHAFRLNMTISAAEREQLLEATANALQLLLASWCTAQACAACILFLGVACQGKYLYAAFTSAKYHFVHSACKCAAKILSWQILLLLIPYKPHKPMLAGLEAEQMQNTALAACVAIQAHKAELRHSSHITELTAGTANLVIGLQVLFLKHYKSAQPASAPAFCIKLPHHQTYWEPLTHAVSIIVTGMPNESTDPNTGRDNPLSFLAVSR